MIGHSACISLEGRRKMIRKEDLLEKLERGRGSVAFDYEELLFIAGSAGVRMTIDEQTRSGDSWYNIKGSVTIGEITGRYEAGLYASQWARLHSKLAEGQRRLEAQIA